MPTEVLPHLFLGQRPRSYAGFDVVVDCTSRRSLSHRFGLIEDFDGVFLHVPMVDTEDFVLDEVAMRAAAQFVAASVRGDRDVLVHCQAGRNRSGLVVALAVRELLGCSGAEAVTLLRKMRDLTGGRSGQPVLSNATFERFALDG